MRVSPASSRVSISGSLRYEADPDTSDTYGARSKIFSPSCCATQPSTPKRLPCLVQLLVIVQAIEDLLLRLIADRAGVVEDQPGVFFGLHLRGSPAGQQRANHLFGVMGIHLAAEGLQIECFFGCHRPLSVYGESCLTLSLIASQRYAWKPCNPIGAAA